MNKTDIADLLLTPQALVTLTKSDAECIIGYMLLTRFTKDKVIFDSNSKSDYLMLVLDGDVVVEKETSGDGSLVVDVLGAGHIIGEMGVIDGEPRSAKCVANTVVDVAMLSRDDLERLILEEPQTAVRFLMALAKRLADRLRMSNHKLLVMSQVHNALQQELNNQNQKKRFGSK